LATEVKIFDPKDKWQAADVDLEVIKPIAVIFQDGKGIVYHGGRLNSLLRYRNKRLVFFSGSYLKMLKSLKRRKSF